MISAQENYSFTCRQNSRIEGGKRRQTDREIFLEEFLKDLFIWNSPNTKGWVGISLMELIFMVPFQESNVLRIPGHRKLISVDLMKI